MRPTVNARIWLAAAALLAAGCAPLAADDMDYGPFLSATIAAQWPKDNYALKGIAVRLGEGRDAGMCFDTDLLRWSAGWTGGWLTYTGVAFDGKHGVPGPGIAGTQVFATAPGPGWSRTGDFADPRKEPFGPLPAGLAKYKGLYLSGQRVVVSYTVGACPVLELPGIEAGAPRPALSRTVRVGDIGSSLSMLVCELPQAKGGVGPIGDKAGGKASGDAAKSMAVLGDSPEVPGLRLVVGVVGAPAGSSLAVKDGRVLLNLDAAKGGAVFKVVVWSAADGDLAPFAGILAKAGTITDPQTLTKGGPGRWKQEVTTRGTLGTGDAAYVVDTITAPEQNPWRSNLRFGGFDFSANGRRAALSTWSGDVWLVDGIDDDLAKLAWKRYATGLYQPLGLRIVDDVVYCLGRDQITRLHDLDQDGEADFYENFNNDVQVTRNFHEFAFDLHTDKEGAFYFTKGGPVPNGGNGFERIAAHHGCLMKVSKDGAKLEVVASGFRAPNGMGLGPNGELTTGDNQGSWMPACRINLVRPGGFYGVPPLAHREPVPTDYDRPICWLPMSVSNSDGGQAWVTSERWGPFANQLLHLSYGKCSLFKVLMEKVDGQVQGGVVRFPLAFNTGVMRARFHPGNGQLYVCGLRGWQTDAAKGGGFQRVRYTGKPVHLPIELKARRNGIAITFCEPLDKATACDPANWSLEQWNYKWSSGYGSDDFKVSDGSKGRDPVAVSAISLSADRKTATLAIPGLKPCMQMRIVYKISAADGTAISQEIVNTIHKLP